MALSQAGRFTFENQRLEDAAAQGAAAADPELGVAPEPEPVAADPAPAPAPAGDAAIITRTQEPAADE